ncbi:STAS domain-containing protein [Umezawaea sp. Da 62-37]|uniref:STAS domain-containing protein n=1 Tax=Umezawaea sp. Da 62-37 TaxID=3075927 RepID=UPI0028F6FD41|nr:STAS domain-containing protein [Umezawaea sp. Da 62-37]WNV89052.1 STAS domain-containing protein [Umezawaea sp. Da 62-37]
MPRSSVHDAGSGSGPDHSTPLRVLTEHVEGVLVVRVAGEIDMNTAPKLGDHLTAAFAAAAADEAKPAVVVDFGEVEFLASIGLSLLVANHQAGEANGTPMHLVVSSRAVLRSITSAALDRLFTLHPSVDAAVAAAR